MSSRATSFYFSFLSLPAEQRRAIIAVWDFCRAVDDAVDEPGDRDPHAAVKGWREEVSRLFGTADPETNEGKALKPFIRRFGLPRAAFEDLIDGVAMDLTRQRYETFADLREYCVRVASAVGLICVEIFGYQDARAREYAVELGLALQLTNILRDVPQDLARDRVYIPAEEVRRFGCSVETLRAGVMTPELTRLLEHQADRAGEYFRRADAALPEVDRRRLVAARMMGEIYRELLRSIVAAEFDVFGRRIRVSRLRQAAIAGATWVKVMAGMK